MEVAYRPDEVYRGIVYVAVSSGDNDDWKEYSCYIDELPDMLERLHVDDISNEKNRKNIYITHNSFKTFRGRADNDDIKAKAGLFSYNNFVIDIDCHDKSISISQNYTLMHNLIPILSTELSKVIPCWSIAHYTGRGLQLWWCFEQVSRELHGPYRITLCRMIEEIDRILQMDKYSDYKCVHVDKTSKKENGFFRLFDTYNSEASKYSMAIIQNDKIYKIQEIIDAVNNNLSFSNNVSLGNEKIDVPEWTQFTIQNKKRMNLLESLVDGRVSMIGYRELCLFIYYNCARGVYNTDLAQEKVKNLNNSFDVPLSDSEVKSVFTGIDKRYKDNNPYRYTNASIIELFDITEAEQDRYKFKPAGVGDFTGRVQNSTRDEQRKIKKENRDFRIISLYASGMTQVNVSKEIGCSRPTVSSVLKKNNINRTQENIRQIQLLKADGLTQVEVSEVLKIGYRTVQRYWCIPNT